ncbi:S1C family serine protease [Paenibacillus sp. FSL R7-0128]|uniref:S1C family serine protease n=1 Tax=Paenibacillus sp. FSL R7-0128 TaxID=2954529 RepID=UPI0030F93105
MIKRICIMLLVTFFMPVSAGAYPYNQQHTFQAQLETARANTTIVTAYYTSRFEGTRIQGIGTGTLVGDGLLLTNAHVVGSNTGALHIDVTTYDNVVHDGTLLRIDRSVDLALIRIDSAADGFALSGTQIYPGMQVMTVGQPQGLAHWSFSEGAIVDISRSCIMTSGERWTAIMTDAQSIHGNSGGPLINDRGKLVGIMRGAAEGYSFAIPIEGVREFLQ